MRRVFLVLLIVSFCVLLAETSLPAADTKAATPLSFDTSLFVENDVEIKSRLTGIVDELLVDRGAEVRRGTPLARLESKDLMLQMERANTVMLEAETSFQRAKSLFDQQLLSASEYDLKRLAFDRAKADRDLAQVNFEKSTIAAPFAGVVVERYVQLGQRVVEDDNVPLFRIAAMTPLLARIYVPEDLLTLFTVGKKAEFASSLATAQKIPARVKWISPVIDPASGMASVILEIQEKDGRRGLKPGTSGKVWISTQ